jgi:hypothetical protein
MPRVSRADACGCHRCSEVATLSRRRRRCGAHSARRRRSSLSDPFPGHGHGRSRSGTHRNQPGAGSRAPPRDPFATFPKELDLMDAYAPFDRVPAVSWMLVRLRGHRRHDRTTIEPHKIGGQRRVPTTCTGWFFGRANVAVHRVDALLRVRAPTARPTVQIATAPPGERAHPV